MHFFGVGYLCIYIAMPNPDVITSNAVATLLSGAYSDVCYVQVLVVTQRSSLAGVKKYNISIYKYNSKPYSSVKRCKH